MRSGRRWAFAIVSSMFAAVLLGGAASAAFGQAPLAPVGGDRVLTQDVSLPDIIRRGGVLMYPLGAMSVIGVALVVYFFVVLRREQVAPAALHKDIVGKIGSGALDDARMACAYRPCPLAEVALAALDFVQASPKGDPQLLKEAIEGEGSRQAAGLQAQIQYLLDVAVISPMIGLLGTVFGMMRAFNVVAFDLAKAKPMLLAAGVAEALITTAAGLIIGIPAMIFFAYFRNRTTKLVSVLEGASSEILNALLKQRAP